MWSELPRDIIVLILKRLLLVDYIRFGAVCVSWRRVVAEKCHPPAPQLPWIYRPIMSDYHCHSISEDKDYKFHLPEIANRRCCGSCSGWLIISDESKKEAFLLNPIFRQRIQLPSYSSFGTHCFMSKAVLSSAPSSSKVPLNECIVAAIFGYGTLGFCKLGDVTWSILRDKSLCFLDIIIHKGLLYAMSTEWRTKVWKLVPHPEVSTPPPPATNVIGLEELIKFSLVESCDELFLVIILHENNWPFEFDIFKLDRSANSWVLAECLGDHLLFLSSSDIFWSGYQSVGSISLNAKDFAGTIFRKNCIYSFQGLNWSSYKCSLEDRNIDFGSYLPARRPDEIGFFTPCPW